MSSADRVQQLLESRPTVGGWSQRPISDDALLPLLETVRVAPSADNLQIWRLVVVRTHATCEAILKALPPEDADRLRGATVLVVFAAWKHFIGRVHKEQPFFLIDVPLAAVHLILAAAEGGLRAEQSFPEEESAVLQAIAAGPSFRVACIVGLGWPSEVAGTDECVPSKTIPAAFRCFADRFGQPWDSGLV